MARTYRIETFGCQMNVHDSERLGGLLQQAGYEPSPSMEQADLVVVNTCSVRERAEEKLFARVDRFRHVGRGRRPIIAVTGCVAQQEGEGILKRAPMVDVVIGTQALATLPAAVDAVRRTREPYVDVNPYDNVSFPLGVAVRGDPVKAFVTIIEGCNDFCAFCVVPYTRGHERMRPAQEILAEVEEAAAAGHREVHLLGQIVNHYQAPDIPGCDFAGLLERVHGVRGIVRIRFASPHPRHVTSRLIAAVRDLPKVCKHLHLPVQSGSTRVLSRMRRRHTRERYLALVGEIRAAVPGIALSTDMIVGFPGETVEDFEQTMSLVRDGALRQHVLLQVLRASEHAGEQTHAGHRVGDREEPAAGGAAGRAAADSAGATRIDGRTDRDGAGRRAEPAARRRVLRADERQHGRQLPGGRGGHRADDRRRDQARRPEQRVGYPGARDASGRRLTTR